MNRVVSAGEARAGRDRVGAKRLATRSPVAVAALEAGVGGGRDPSARSGTRARAGTVPGSRPLTAWVRGHRARRRTPRSRARACARSTVTSRRRKSRRLATAKGRHRVVTPRSGVTARGCGSAGAIVSSHGRPGATASDTQRGRPALLLALAAPLPGVRRWRSLRSWSSRASGQSSLFAACRRRRAPTCCNRGVPIRQPVRLAKRSRTIGSTGRSHFAAPEARRRGRGGSALPAARLASIPGRSTARCASAIGVASAVRVRSRSRSRRTSFYGPVAAIFARASRPG